MGAPCCRWLGEYSAGVHKIPKAKFWLYIVLTIHIANRFSNWRLKQCDWLIQSLDLSIFENYNPRLVPELQHTAFLHRWHLYPGTSQSPLQLAQTVFPGAYHSHPAFGQNIGTGKRRNLETSEVTLYATYPYLEGTSEQIMYVTVSNYGNVLEQRNVIKWKFNT